MREKKIQNKNNSFYNKKKKGKSYVNKNYKKKKHEIIN